MAPWRTRSVITQLSEVILSPQINIKETPAGSKSLALIVEDPDAPVGLFVHWVIFNIPPDTKAIDENIEKSTMKD